MVNYICENCNRLFEQKSHYDKHLERKNPCKKTNNLETVIEKTIKNIVEYKKEKIETNPIKNELKNDQLNIGNADAYSFIKSLNNESLGVILSHQTIT